MALYSSLPVASIVEHLKWFRFGCLPLKINQHGFHEISMPFLLYTSIMVLNAVMPTQQDLKGQGPFTTGLSILEQLTYKIYYPLMLILVLLNRKDFDKTVKQLMGLQRHLSIHQYNMFLSVKIYVTVIAFIVLVFIALSTERYFAAVDDTDSLQDIVYYWFLVTSTICSTLLHTVIFAVFSYLVCCIGSCYANLSNTKFVLNKDLRRFVRIYNHLLEVSLKINSYNDANVTLTVLVTFLSLIQTTSSILKMMSIVYNAIAGVLVQICLLLTMNYHVIHVCHSAMKQVSIKSYCRL